MTTAMPLAGNPLHRAGNERRDPAWLAAALASGRTRFLPVQQLKVPVGPGAGGFGSPIPRPGCGARSEGDGGARPVLHDEEHRLAWARAGDWLEQAGEPFLLGLEADRPRFAVDVSALPEPVAACGLRAGVEFQGLRTAAPNLPAGDAAIAAQARSLAAWHERHPFCAACGGETRPRNGGSSRSCPSCGAEHFPRTDPVVIVVVSRGGRALLGRSGRFPGNLYSALAGFMEAGESVEEAVRREVAEEAGIRVGGVRYVASQPWPFPASLMIGCLAEGLSDEITIDPQEIEDARWFSRAELAEALAGRGQRVERAAADRHRPPPDSRLARGLIVLCHVQHLLGIGHLTRTATLARTLAAEDFEVTVASGGEPVAGIDFGGASLVQLPPARVADRRFKQLVDEHGEPAGEAWKARRRERLLALYEDVGPDVVLTELFPFGRRQLRFELLPLLDRCAEDRRRTGRPRVACSVRDILVESPKPARIREMLELARRYYDLVLVHGDPRFVSLDATFPHAREIADRIAYTGYVVARPEGLSEQGLESRGESGEVIVSAGGGAVGGRLLEAALAARPRTRLADIGWRLLAGANLPEAVLRSLAARAPEGVAVERFRPDFTTLLRRAHLSISQGGYNTLMEVLDARLRAVIVPYAGGLETEQTLRAELLAARGLIEVVSEDRLDPVSLAAAIDRALAKPHSSGLTGLDTSGAATTLRALRELGQQGRPQPPASEAAGWSHRVRLPADTTASRYQ